MGKFIKIDGIEAFFDEINNTIEKAEDIAIEELAHIGEKAVAHARLKGEYGDRTGNLRSSIGYIVLKDGQPVIQGQPQEYPARPGYDKVPKTGVANGQKLLQELSAKFPTGITLIVCAGMEYASYVEDIHGLDVLTSAEMIAENMVNQLIGK